MRAIFGMVSLLVALAVVGLLVKNQLKVVNKPVGASLPPAQSAAESPPAAPAASTVRAEVQQLQQRVGSDVAKALEQGTARSQEADK
jgi:hypothetical protein